MFAAAAVLMASCGGGGGRPTFGDNEFPVVTVGTSSTSMQQTYPATIKGVQDVQISPKVQGFITQINVKEGQSVGTWGSRVSCSPCRRKPRMFSIPVL